MQEALRGGMSGSSDTLAYKVSPIPSRAVYLAQDLGTSGLKIAYENVFPRRAIYT